MENFEIVNDRKSIVIPSSLFYIVFPYNSKREENNKYYYGRFAEEVNFEIIKENKDIELPTFTYNQLILSQ